jgi:TRAP-type mannitol/chloroaromatic compound transport system permease small subunit
MKPLLAVSSGIDRMNEAIGRVTAWMVLVAVIISAGNAIIRKLFNISSNAWLEAQWYLFGAIVLLGAAATLLRNEHVRVDLIYGAVSDRARLWIDLFGLVFLLMPFVAYSAYLCWPIFVSSFNSGEMSSNSGGLIRWPVKLILPAGFALLTLQGLSEIIKRIAALTGVIHLETKYSKPLQ